MVDIRSTAQETEKKYRKIIDFVRPLPESRVVISDEEERIMYQSNVTSFEQLALIKTVLETLDAPLIIGVWKTADGLQQGYEYENQGTDEEPNLVIVRSKILDENENEIDVPIEYHFSIIEYTKYLHDIIEYNSEGTEISRRRPTESEARNTQVNKFAGSPDRNLQTLS